MLSLPCGPLSEGASQEGWGVEAGIETSAGSPEAGAFPFQLLREEQRMKTSLGLES